MRSQRTQYKPYDYELDFAGDSDEPRIYVEIDVPDADIIEQTGQKVVLNLSGLNHVLTVTADSIDKINDEHVKKVKGDK